ncbi:hypothetical protein F1559_003001 [Cyanidiococcus yangmingshanensis]|uniref:Iron hydrogenase large subunit C-terminal domain-containing protein n=1 Tax=Cyanidiococcus yangmingshanensis TaxID=2690220 RepID=A0A7J7ILR2_9RHOD|nr:hypothetical protein F1559_003001 [Cyanidiococcus yangmingshanensis]
MSSSVSQGRFSTGLRITDLDDFLPNSTECVLPMQGGAIPAGSVAAPLYGSHSSGASTSPADAVARVTLSDCLSCSGCITSAETVLLSAHSVDAFVAESRQRATQVGVVAVAPAVLVSLACAWQTTDLEYAFERLQRLFNEIGEFVVLMNGAGRCLSVLETCAEAAERLPCDANGEHASQGPLFASACPGWTFYVEKTQTSMVPYLSKAKSPQAMMALLARHCYGAEAWFVSLAPCFDKKLESQRETLREDNTFVLTTGEVLELSMRFERAQHSELERRNGDCLERLELIPLRGAWSTFGGLSGGYAVEVFRYVAKNVFHYDVAEADLKLAPVRERNPDLQQLLLYEDCTTGAFSVTSQSISETKRYRLRYAVATAYGFRNIQNIVRRMKTSGACAWDFVEVMACPGGCGNGGGQWLPAESLGKGSVQSSRRQHVRQLEQKGQWLPQYHVEECPQIVELWTKLRASAPESLRITFAIRHDLLTDLESNEAQRAEATLERSASEAHRIANQW